ncbi:TetR/AcrR family transcriptional regulator [Mycetocola reblochoni]|uniref:Transcriptional regulator, TetR family n=2 Tax=Mycetocola reblochoni TaxID=331618 RepID=A0A1R4JMT3_9MICO|nr:TetR/AcrR family transcriptional regulator [Mycetocola reblochoni]RLP68592.1 TetR family transcriptional regulator [Mycetocola reblochoni]SJN33336.1 Transcriptional regulator, TetR family [Mycetocola reblochoni REB411]
MTRTRDDDRRERLSAATWTVLARDGVSGLTLRAVAAEAGCTTGLVLHAFADKRALLLHARELLHSRGTSHADALDDGTRGPADVLRLFLLRSVDAGPGEDDGTDRNEDARVWLGFLAASLSDPVLAERHRQGNHAFLGRCAALIGRALPELGERECEERALALSATVEGLNTLSTADPDRYDRRVRRSAVDGAIRTALAPRP